MKADDIDELQRMAEIGRQFSGQWRGRRPGVLKLHVRATVERTRPATLDDLLDELEFQALRNRTLGTGLIQEVDRSFEYVRYQDAGRVRECTFKRIANVAGIRKSRKALTREIA